MSNKWFTIYWANGTISHIFGSTIEEAFSYNGYNDNAISDIDWYDNGITQTHWWDNKKEVWVEYLTIEIKVADFLQLDLNDLLRIMNTHNTIIVKFEDNNTVNFYRNWGCFIIDQTSCWVNYLQICFGKYHKGSYDGDSDDEENSFHYDLHNSQYFAPDNLPYALEAFISRVKTSPYKSISDYDEQIESIHNRQREAFYV